MVSPLSQSDIDDADQIFLAFARALLMRMEEWIASEHVPVVYDTSTVFYEDSWPGEPDSQHTEWAHTPIEERKDYQSLMFYSHRDPIWASKEAQECVKYWEKIVGASISPREVSTPENLPQSVRTYAFLCRELVVPILHVLDHYDTLHPTQEQLLDCFHRFRDERTRIDVAWDITIPLLNMIGDMQYEETLGSFRLAPFTAEEKTVVWNNTFENTPLHRRQVFPISIDTFSRVAFQLKITLTWSRSVYEKSGAISKTMSRNLTWFSQIPSRLGEKAEELEDILTALRLTRAGNVKPFAIIENSQTSFHWRSSGSVVVFHEQPTGRYTKRYERAYILHEIDLPAVRTCFDVLQKARSQNAVGNKPQDDLSVAVRRFNQAYDRDSYEDQILDLIIALESSLLAGIRDELKYRLCLRGAALLTRAEPRWEPSKSKALLAKLYDVRSGIVHDGKRLADFKKDFSNLQPAGMSSQEFYQQCENIVRNILRVYILQKKNGKTVEQVNKELDDCIIEGLLSGANAGTEQSYEQH